MTTSTEATRSEQLRRLAKIQTYRQELAKRQGKRYAAKRESHKRRTESKETRGAASDLFKNGELHKSLVTAQQNASNFHAFTKVFCALPQRPAAWPVSLPEIPPNPKACLQLLTDDQCEGSITGNFVRGNNED